MGTGGNSEASLSPDDGVSSTAERRAENKLFLPAAVFVWKQPEFVYADLNHGVGSDLIGFNGVTCLDYFLRDCIAMATDAGNKSPSLTLQ